MASIISAGTTSGTALNMAGDTSGVLQLATNGSTTALTIDTSQNVGIGTSSPAHKLQVVNTSAGALTTPALLQNRGNASGTKVQLAFIATGSDFSDGQYAAVQGVAEGGIGNTSNALAFVTSTSGGAATERMRITSGGSLCVGFTSSSYTFQAGGGAASAGQFSVTGAAGSIILDITKNNYGTATFYTVDGGVANGAAAGMIINARSSTGRAINAGGSVNANGTDYAEYMYKSGDFTIAKGDVCGINSSGQLTNVFAEAISFVVKSTNPSYIGGDDWFNEVLAKDATEEEKQAYEAKLEIARQAVDRIAFCGQVPVNVLNATAGQYIIPINDNGAIKGEAVSNPTFEQYQIAVGKVIAIEEDGRARIIVKVA
jgi:hypothetical protein